MGAIKVCNWGSDGALGRGERPGGGLDSWAEIRGWLGLCSEGSGETISGCRSSRVDDLRAEGVCVENEEPKVASVVRAKIGSGGGGQSSKRQREGEAGLQASFTGSDKPEGLCPYWQPEAVSGYEAKVCLFDLEQQLICWILTPKSNLGTWIVYFHNLNTPQVVEKKIIFLTSATRISLREGTILD